MKRAGRTLIAMTSDDTAPSGLSRAIETYTALTPAQAEDVLRLLAEAARADGQQAVSEQGRLQLKGGAREGVRHLLLTLGDELIGYAQLEDTDPVEAPAAELVVHPAVRGTGTAGRWARRCSPSPASGCGCGRTAGTPPPGTSRRSSGSRSSANCGRCGGRWRASTCPSRSSRTG